MHHIQNLPEKNQKTQFPQKTRGLKLKIQKHISPFIVLRKHEWTHMNANFAGQRREESCKERSLRGLNNQNRKQPLNICESSIVESHIEVH